MSNAAVKLSQGKLIVIGLMFTTKYSCCYNNLKPFCLHTGVGAGGIKNVELILKTML